MQLLSPSESIPELHSTCHPQHLPCLLNIPPQHPTPFLLPFSPHQPHPPRSLSGPSLSDRIPGPGAGERASTTFVTKVADLELPQQQQLRARVRIEVTITLRLTLTLIQCKKMKFALVCNLNCVIWKRYWMKMLLNCVIWKRQYVSATSHIHRRDVVCSDPEEVDYR